MKPRLIGLAIATSLLAASCTNPNQASNHPGSPPAINERRNESPDKASPYVEGNVAPQKYGIPALMEHARNQAGEAGPNASLGINEDQYRGDTTTGRPKTPSKKRLSKP